MGRALLPLVPDALAPPRTQLDLADRGAVGAYLARLRPRVVVHLAARVGGILAQARQPLAFLLDNLAIDGALLAALAESPPAQLIVILSSCIYPQLPAHAYPLAEDAMEAGPPPSGHAGYAQAKRSLWQGGRLLAAQTGCGFTALVPTNLYGPGDHVDGDGDGDNGGGEGTDGGEADRRHFVAAALGRLERAARAGTPAVRFIGTGRARRQLTYAPDLARLIAHLTTRPPGESAPGGALHGALNVAPARQWQIAELAAAVAAAVGYAGAVQFSGEGPDGPDRKDVCAARLHRLVPAYAGWETPLPAGLAATVRWLRARSRTP